MVIDVRKYIDQMCHLRWQPDRSVGSWKVKRRNLESRGAITMINNRGRPKIETNDILLTVLSHGHRLWPV